MLVHFFIQPLFGITQVNFFLYYCRVLLNNHRPWKQNQNALPTKHIMWMMKCCGPCSVFMESFQFFLSLFRSSLALNIFILGTTTVSMKHLQAERLWNFLSCWVDSNARLNNAWTSDLYNWSLYDLYGVIIIRLRENFLKSQLPGSQSH